jgi:hypothetical protein
MNLVVDKVKQLEIKIVRLLKIIKVINQEIQSGILNLIINLPNHGKHLMN